MSPRLHRAAPLAAFGALCYMPLLLTSPGKVVADTKSYLYIDPARMLSRAWSMWDPHVGMGTVTHQNIGFLWPMGPYYWAMERVGAPDWVAQRLWLGSIMLAAGLGTRYLLRTFGWRGPGVGVAMCAYALTPYLLTIAVRISVILLPFAALPWMIALTARAVRGGGWRHPAAFALVVATVGTSNATSILLAGVGPLLWVLWTLVQREQSAGRVAATVGRIGILTLATNAWWIVGLSVQATHGVEVLRYTESVETTAAASSAQEVLRGLGYWFFYGDDALGPWVGPSRPFQSSTWLLTVTFAVPVLALAAGGVTRWRERSFIVLLALVGLVLAVGVYPYDDPSLVGRALRVFLESDVGMAMRSLPRAAPLVVLALSVMLGAGVHALGRRQDRLRLPAAAAVIGLVVLALPPLWQRTLVPENLRRPEELPSYWREAGRHLDATDDGTRVLELPGSDFTSYRWGTTVDPVTPGLTDRPIVARELVPMGSAAAWNLLKAFDGRLQAGVAERSTVAPVARTMRAGQILVRSDLEYEHYDTPRPKDLWRFLLGAPGLGPATEFGRPTPNVAGPPAPMLDELELSLDPTLRDPFPVTVLPVEDALPIIAIKPVAVPVVIAGDGDGIVDSAAAGLLDGTELLRYSAEMSDAELDRALGAGAVLIVTDSNRRRAERWGSIRFTSGYTEPAGLTPLAVDRTDARLPVFPHASDATRTVAVHRGGVTANATSYGGRNEYLPEDRPANALDGDPTTAWRTSRDDPVKGERLAIELDEPATTSTITFLAPPPPINRWVTRAALRFDDDAPVVIELDERSRAGSGQEVDVGARTFSRLEIEILADTAGSRPRYGGLTSTGFAEVRPPVDLLRRAGTTAVGRPLAVVLTRLRSAVTDVERSDEEPVLVRLVELPDARSFAVHGTARLSPRASDDLIDRLLGGAPDRTVTASSRLAGARSRASAALDGDPRTAWTAAYGDPAGQWIRVQTPGPVTVDALELTVLADGRHSVPTELAIDADGQRVATVAVPPITDQRRPDATTTVRIPLPAPVTGAELTVTITDARRLETTDWSTRRIRTLPVAIAELGVGGLARPAPEGDLALGCRSDLLTADGTPVPVAITGTVEDALAGAPLSLSACDAQPLFLPTGQQELRAADGRTTGIDLDRLVLRSAAGGAASTAATTLRAEVADPDAVAAPAVAVVSERADSLTVRVRGARPGQALWLAFGQGWSDGWEASIDGTSLGEPSLVDGFANGWRIVPESDTFEVALRFAPQQRVTMALWGSLVAALICLGLALRGPRRQPAAATDGDLPAVGEALRSGGRSAHDPLTPVTALAAALGLGLLGAAVANPAVGGLVGLLTLLGGLALVPRWATALAAPALMALAGLYVVVTVARDRVAPGLEWAADLHRAHPVAWLAVLALTADAVLVALRHHRRR